LTSNNQGTVSRPDGAPDARSPRVLAVFAHPDDESLACGGTLARLSDLGADVALLCASRGERGAFVDRTGRPDGDLGAMRTLELRAAADVLGLLAIDVLEHPDGSLRALDEPGLQPDILAAIQRFDPDAVITFDDDGLYWHADHIGVHEATRDAVRSLGTNAPALYYVTLDRRLMPGVVQHAATKHWTPPADGLWSIEPAAFGIAARPPSFAVDIRPWVLRKLAALQCHRTQMGAVNPFSLLDEPAAQDLLGYEYFRRAPIPCRSAPFIEQLADAPAPQDIHVAV
jgi:LmbE family N-acetylglucosaminyl deacetylase